MKILFITLRSDEGGGPQHLFDLCHGLKNCGLDFAIAAPSEGHYGSHFKRLGSLYFELPHRRFSFRRALALLQFCRQSSVTLIHSHGRGAGVYRRFLGLFGFKVIHTFHGAHTPSTIKRKFVSMLSLLTDISICVSHSEKETVLNEGQALAQNCVVIENGVKLKEKTQRPESHPPVLGILARFDPVKNHKAFLEILSKNTEIFHSVLLAGDGETFEECQRLVIEKNLSERVQFLGMVSDIDSFFQKIDVLVSFSMTEGMPLAVLESMSRGVPVLVSKIPAHEEILSDFPELVFQNAEEFVRKLEGLDFSVREKLIAIIRQKYDLELMIQKTIKLYSDLK